MEQEAGILFLMKNFDAEKKSLSGYSRDRALLTGTRWK